MVQLVNVILVWYLDLDYNIYHGAQYSQMLSRKRWTLFEGYQLKAICMNLMMLNIVQSFDFRHYKFNANFQENQQITFQLHTHIQHTPQTHMLTVFPRVLNFYLSAFFSFSLCFFFFLHLWCMLHFSNVKCIIKFQLNCSVTSFHSCVYIPFVIAFCWFYFASYLKEKNEKLYIYYWITDL